MRFTKQVEIKQAITLLEGNETDGITCQSGDGYIVNRTAAIVKDSSTVLRVTVKGSACDIMCRPCF